MSLNPGGFGGWFSGGEGGGVINTSRVRINGFLNDLPRKISSGVSRMQENRVSTAYAKKR
jgi:hypothetical protein